VSSLIDVARHPHRRFNPLRGEWLQVSPQRTERPWQGEIDPPPDEAVAAHDPKCYLCPGSARVRGVTNPDYKTTFVFDNDFAALQLSTPAATFAEADLLVARTEPGVCRVVCFSPCHNLTLARMDRPGIRAVVDTWIDECARIAAYPEIGYVLVFENRGAAMGASNPHPHGQIWATATVPNEPAREQTMLEVWRDSHGSCLLCDYLALETERGERVIVENESFAAIVPFWAVWPFETLVTAKRHVTGLDALDDRERDGLADLLKRLTTRYDNLFQTPFPYSMGFHQRPTDGGAHEEWHLHAHFYPPLLRSATVRKFMVGFEMLGTPQRDLTPEEAAERLRAAGEEHYRG
jgi:UDPglucose--hexose-1-phosphate uridylyltransferase